MKHFRCLPGKVGSHPNAARLPKPREAESGQQPAAGPRREKQSSRGERTVVVDALAMEVNQRPPEIAHYPCLSFSNEERGER